MGIPLRPRQQNVCSRSRQLTKYTQVSTVPVIFTGTIAKSIPKEHKYYNPISAIQTYSYAVGSAHR
eukprot:5549269-Amphidinium_carterae.1